jgi:hypothetical protein
MPFPSGGCSHTPKRVRRCPWLSARGSCPEWFKAMANRTGTARFASYSGRVRLMGWVHRRSEQSHR